ncbi:EAL domain-containing protein [Pseudoxanthomonas sp. PXM02]|uniref:putative bifunctional diguanylate cyclase/phosphodiesterase n=1 Tax=Pseudoxanthomonas sp. PXM02 TaxID=2769294 RepID=UPI001787617F|nr:EAL domain-containing protein [Pseudoxanthomonas sp. PXM02]MBD9478905.1 EAL domain-containing protein [Pseudoxanthomonas sp. PXM02]
MRGLWERLRACWALPGADESANGLLLSRQLRALFRVVPWYVASNFYTTGGVLWVMRPFLDARSVWPWLAFFVLAHAGWGWHAYRCLRRSPHEGAPSLGRSDLRIGALWCGLCALACGSGIYMGAPLAASDGSRLLLSAYTPGLIATGVLVGITTPLLSFTWLSVLTVSACLMVVRLDFLAQGMTVTLLCSYALMLSIALLFASHLFVRRVEAELAADRQGQIVGLLLRDFESKANDWLWESDREGVLTRAAHRLAQMLGYGHADLVGKRLDALFASQRLVEVQGDGDVGAAALRPRLRMGEAFTGVVVEAMVEGRPRSWMLSAKPLHGSGGEWIGWRGVGCDVSDARLREADARARERHLHHLAHHDPLTGLPNRRAFLDALEAGSETWHAVAMIDLDNFKTINDSLGHAAGDHVLCIVADRLQRACRPGDMLARLGGDEFAVLLRALPPQHAEEEVRARLSLILEALRVPEQIDDYRVDVRASVGASLASDIAGTGELLRQADNALYAAKREGRDMLCHYSPRMSERLQERLAMVSDLALAAQAGQLELDYMPLHATDDRGIRGYEALLRWRHPLHGRIPPMDFIPTAEESGLIIPIGLWVLERACRDASAWSPDTTLAVNVSAVQLASPTLVESVLDILHRAGMPPGRLELEITESVLARDPAAARSMLQRLRKAGIRVAIDDFGVGYSSMAQLRELPFDGIKLDRSFATALLQDEARDMTCSIIASVVHLARSMHLTVTAEGVETELQFQALRGLGCTLVQGYLFGLPGPVKAPSLGAPAVK